MNRVNFEVLINSRFSKKKANLIMLAYRLSKYGHRNQMRDGGDTRYFEHPRRVAIILLTEFNEKDYRAIIAALLHDIIEDTHILTRDNIRYIFGRKVLELVDGLTKKKDEDKLVYLDRLQRACKKIKRIKLADRLDNLRDMKAWSLDKIRKYCDQTRTFILSWAFKINKKVAQELESICDSY